MSAICGVVGLDGRPWRGADLVGVLDALRPLGDHGGGTWEGRAGRCGVSLGAAPRRRVPEDATDAPPVVSADGRLVLVGDVVLDCRRDLAAALGVAAGSDVADSALVLAAYERWGRGCVAHLSGQFAFAVADDRAGGVFLARDQIGLRPLVVHERSGVVAFATTALSLCGLAGVGHDLDHQRVVEWLALVPSSGSTFVRGVRPFPPASAAWVDERGMRCWRYWELDTDDVVDLGSPAAHAEALRAALDDAVARRLRTTGELGALVSGGLDSASVAATAARQLAPGPLRTYTSVPPAGWDGPVRPGWDADERPLVDDLVGLHPTMRPTFVQVADEPLFDRYDRLFAFGAPPPRNPCNELWLQAIFGAAAADGVATLLEGQRGNVCFSADDPRWLVDLVRRGRLLRAGREIRAWSSATGVGPAGVVRASVVAEVLPAGAARWRRRRREAPDTVAAGLGVSALRARRRAELDPSSLAAVEAPEGAARRRRGAEALLGASGLAEARAAKEAAWGLVLADPTADVRLLAVCAAQPSWVRRSGGTGRRVCRDAMADRLPPTIVHRTRRGAQLPDWFDVLARRRGDLRDELAAAHGNATCRELLDLEALDRAVRSWPTRPDRRRAADDGALTATYRVALLRGLLAARYVRWFEERAGAAGHPPAQPLRT